MDPKLLEYVRAEVQSGIAIEDITAELTKNGWPIPMIAAAFTAAHNPSRSAAAGEKYAGFLVRFAAAMIDGIILYFAMFVLGFGLGLSYPKMGDADPMFLMLFNIGISSAIGWGYHILMIHHYGATWGKMAAGIRVKSEDGGSLTLTRIVVREIPGKLLSSLILMIGFIMAAFTDKKQGLHDKLAHSVVVYKDPDQSRGKIIAWAVAAVLLFVFIIVGMLASVVLS